MFEPGSIERFAFEIKTDKADIAQKTVPQNESLGQFQVNVLCGSFQNSWKICCLLALRNSALNLFFSKTHWTHLSDTFCSSRFLWISPRSFNRIIRPRISSSIPATRVRTRHGLPRSLDNVATPIKISNFMWYTSSNWLYKITKTNVTIVWFESKTKPKS